MINMDFNISATCLDCKTVWFILGFILPNFKEEREREGLQTLDRCDGGDGGGGTKQTCWNLKKNISIIFIIVTDYKARQTGHNHVTVLGNTDNIYIEINFRHCPAI